MRALFRSYHSAIVRILVFIAFIVGAVPVSTWAGNERKLFSCDVTLQSVAEFCDMLFRIGEDVVVFNNSEYIVSPTLARRLLHVFFRKTYIAGDVFSVRPQRETQHYLIA